MKHSEDITETSNMTEHHDTFTVQLASTISQLDYD